MANPNPPHISSVSWPATANIGDEVTLTANLASVKDGTSISFVISEYSGNAPKKGGFHEEEITTLEAEAQGGKAEVKWTVPLAAESSKTGGPPEYRFRAILYSGQAGVASKLLKLDIKITITKVSIVDDRIDFTISPNDLPSGTIKVLVKGRKKEVTMLSTDGGGGGHSEKFDWTKFPQTAGEEFVATSLTVQWTKNDVTIEASQAIRFTGYGKLRITKFYTPKDANFGAKDTEIPKDAECFSKKQTIRVNREWMVTVSSNEGVGEFDGNLVLIRECRKKDKKNKTVELSYRMLTTEGGGPVAEGKYRSPLDAASSLAKHGSDKRFAKGDQIYLPGIGTNPHTIDDTGNWKGGNNRLDKFNGRGGPDLGKGDFGSVYVVKLPKAK